MANKSTEANLFTFQANLKQNGTIELTWEGVKPEQFESAMVEGLPQWDGSHYSVPSTIPSVYGR